MPGTFQELQQAVWKEITNRGCSEASAALSEMLKVPLRMTGMVAGRVPITKIPFLTGDPERVVTGARLAFSGDISGHMILILWPESWEECRHLLLPKGRDAELETSAFAEMANLACSFFISSLANLTHMVIHFTPPEVMEDMTATVLEDTLIKFSEESADLLTVETTFTSSGAQIKGFLLFIPSHASVKTITQRFLEAAATLDLKQS